MNRRQMTAMMAKMMEYLIMPLHRKTFPECVHQMVSLHPQRFSLFHRADILEESRC